MFFSIILPVYNGERFLSQSIESVLSQSFRDYELIIINDGSTDSTLNICLSYTSSDTRIRIVNKQNEGVSVARNQGLNIAKGEYILFIDSDDILYVNALNILHEKLCDVSLDYLRYEYQTIDENGKKLYPNYEAKIRAKYQGQILKSTDCIRYLVRNEFFLWSGVFKRSLIEYYHICFLEGCTYCEDTLFMMQYFMQSTNHLYLPSILYGYRKTDSAVTSHFTEKNFTDVKSVIENLINMTHLYNDDKTLVLKRTIEEFTFSILTKNNAHRLKREIVFCMKSPILSKWKIIGCLGVQMGLKLLYVIDLVKKIIRKLC